MKRAASEEAASFQVKQLRTDQSSENGPASSETTLCSSCANLDLHAILSRKAVGKDGRWEARVERSTKHSSCSLCRLFAAMTIDLKPPGKGARAGLYERWIERGSSYYIKTFSTEHVFGIRSQKGLPSVLLSVLPGLLRGSKVDYGSIGDKWKPWKDTANKPGFILVAGPPSKSPGFNGRRISSAAVDFDWILDCIQYCSETHQDCLSPQTSQRLNIKLIDCKSRIIVDAQTDWKYVALSYVWGDGQANWSTDFSRKLPDVCPASIEDSIKAVTRLNHQYLWIDRYCINQQDHTDRNHQITNMDAIYASASLTIVSAGGEDSTYGLPGVGATLRRPQPFAQVGDYLLVSSLPDTATEIGKSRWNSRGWTYQEGLLSRRRLVFTENQAYFQCSGMHCFESMDMPLDELHVRATNKFPEHMNFGRAFPPVAAMNRPMDFLKRINEYSSRSLTYDSDSLNAILGILRVFEKGDPPIYHHLGIPLFGAHDGSSLDGSWILTYSLSLVWDFGTASERRNGFPSWSWVGWKNWKQLKLHINQFGERRQRHSRWRTNLQIGIQSEEGTAVNWMKDSKLDLRALASSSQFINLKSRTATLGSLKVAVSGHHKWRQKEDVRVSCNKKTEPDDNWKAIFLATLYDPDDQTIQKYEHALFLLLERMGDHYERRGVCRTDFVNYNRIYSNDAFNIETIILG